MFRHLHLLLGTLLGAFAVLVSTTVSAAATVSEEMPAQRGSSSTLIWSASATDSPGEGRVSASEYGPPQPQTWGWCGPITKEKKVIRSFKKKGGAKVTLFCGGPKYSSPPTWGLRHIAYRHMRDWENKSFGTFQTWRQVADISMAAALSDPNVRGKVKAGKHCYSRVVYLWDVRRSRIVGTLIAVVIWRADGDRRIITAYPSDSHCDIR